MVKLLKNKTLSVLLTTALFFPIMFFLSGCNEKATTLIPDPVEKWRCVLQPTISEPEMVITLTFDSQNINAYTNVTPENCSDNNVLFWNGFEYLMQNDTLYLKNPDGSVSFTNGNSFKVTRPSDDIMKLEYLGYLFYWAPGPITNYIFNRVTD